MSNKLALYFGYRIIFVSILLLYTFSVHSQAMTLLGVRFLSAAPTFEEPADEQNLLPDTPSYYVIEELYNGDSLTRKGLSLSKLPCIVKPSNSLLLGHNFLTVSKLLPIPYPP